MRKFKFLATVHLLDDILSLLTKLSKVFQKQNVDFSIISPMVHSTIGAIEAMKVQPGPILQQFLDEIIIAGSITPTFKGNNITSYNTSQEEFNKMAMTFMDKFVQNLQNRFPEVDIVSAMKILDPQFLPTTVSALVSYGTVDLEVLLQHYATPKINDDGTEFEPPVDADACRQEFPLFKQLVFHSYSSMSISELWKVIIAKHSECFPAFITLASACFVVPVSTAQCEHGFSTQNRIKSKTRNRLKTKHLDILLRISEEGPSIDDVSSSRAVSKFLKMKERRIIHYN